MRRKDREMGMDFALEVIDNSEYGVAAMVDELGEPYSVALSFVRVGERLYFHCAKEGKKLDALRKNPRVCISFVGRVQAAEDKFTTAFESTVVHGIASEIEEEAEKIEALRALCQKHTPKNMDAFDEAIERSLGRTGVWLVEMEEITAKCKRLK